MCKNKLLFMAVHLWLYLWGIPAVMLCIINFCLPQVPLPENGAKTKLNEPSEIPHRYQVHI